jgi:hypothetical protein
MRRKGLELTAENNLIVSDGLLALFACWFDTLSLNGQPVSDLRLRWLNAILETDLADLVGIFKDGDSMLLKSDDESMSYERFKRALKNTYPNAGAVIAPLKGLLEGWFTERSTNYFSAIHQCFVFITRLNLPGLDDLMNKAVEDYLAGEQLLNSLSYEGEESSLEAKLLTKWFPSKDRSPIFGDWRPKHGPGSVADGKASVAQKYKTMGTDSLLRYVDLRLPEGSTSLPRRPISLERVSKVVFVPKSIDKLRTISMEPTSLQWYQQGFGRNIIKRIHTLPDLRRRINLYKQELNRELAHDGSFDGIYSTIDLSSASDSISYRLVKKLFGRTSLIAPLIATRSSRTELPSGEVIQIDKFAPMGSSLCFPIECLVFASIVEASIMRCNGPVRSSHYRVYGDDLIVETKYAPAVIDRLNQLGFKVNTSKSFTNTQPPFFRESCGGEYLDGADVTPVRLSRDFSGFDVSRRHPSRITALIDLANNTYVKLPSVRRWIIYKLSKLQMGYRVRFDNSGLTGIFSVTPTNYHLGPVKYNLDIQEYYQSCGCLHARTAESDQADEDIRLYEWFRLTAHRASLVYPEDRVSAVISGSERMTWARHNTWAADQDFHAKPNAWESSLEKGYQ